jgi:uncharacterized protein YndB with AHSA1/START domain
MMSETAAALQRDEQGRAVLRFERVLAHPPQRVWEALTQTAQLRSWHPTPFEFEPAVGGRVRYRPDLGGPAMPDGVVLAYEPPRALAYSWGEDELRFELLAGDGDGCVLVLTHAFDDRLKAARDAAGWHLCLRALTAHLDGRPAPDLGEAQRIPDGWSQLNDDYERRFRIPHELATPPPAG